jgi:hypothetical protein
MDGVFEGQRYVGRGTLEAVVQGALDLLAVAAEHASRVGSGTFLRHGE